MQKNLIILLTAIGIVILGGFLLSQYGQAKYTSGFNKAMSEYSAKNLKASSKAINALERQVDETDKMDISDIDRGLINLGIMRERKDR